MSMKISGFTLIRNGTQFDYPYVESLRSLEPIVDELVINVGIGTDDTLTQIQAYAKEVNLRTPGKVVVFESHWPLDDPEKRRGGLILSEQTNLALDRCTGDWAVYLQADEVLHEGDASRFRAALEAAHRRPEIQGLLFHYVHFYGSFDVVQETRSSYRREVRCIRRGSGRSVGDAQSFRGPSGEKLRVLDCGARVFHYGWVRTPEAMKEKTFFMDQLYHGTVSAEQAASGTPHTGDNYRYKRFWGLHRFRDTHPAVMRDRIQRKNWRWDLEASPFVWGKGDLSKVLLDTLEKWTGHRFFEYRSYRKVR